jgi:2-phospho-L-lactate guanylyltransferase
LNGAAVAGVHAAAAEGAARVIVAHADLAKPTPFAWVADFDGVTIVPDRHGRGTNVMALPTGTDFQFAYGDGSCARHEAEARRCGLALRVVRDASLGWDIDEPDDLSALDDATHS